MNRRNLLLLGIALLVILTSWLSQQQKPSGPTDKASVNIPDYFIKGFNSTVTDSLGRPSQRLTAISLYHYPGTDRTTLEQPDITVTGENGIDWHATAKQGELTGGEQQKLLLRDEVMLRQQGDESLTLKTDWLRIDGEHHYAETDAPVSIESARGRIEGIGLNLYGEEQRLLVRSTVRGQYAIN